MTVTDSPPPLAGPFETLELLWDQVQRKGEAVSHVDEVVEIHGSNLRRNVAIRLDIPRRVPDDPGELVFAESAPFAISLRMPKKGVIWPISDLEVDIDPGAYILGHSEHMNYSLVLLSIRYWSVMLPWCHGPDAEKRIAFSQRILQRHLSDIVSLPSPQANACLKRVFRDDGSIRFLSASTFSSAKVRRLHRLCSDLADRYFKFVSVRCSPGDVLEISYSFEDPLPDISNMFSSVEGRKSVGRLNRRSRTLLNSELNALRLKLHSARLCPSYSIQLDSYAGHYVHSQIFMDRTPYGFAAVMEGRSEVSSWRRTDGTAVAHAHLSNGHRLSRPVYLGISTFERPPGSIGRSAVIAWVGLICCLVLATLRAVVGGGFSGDIAGLSLATVSLVSVGVEGLFASRDAARPSLSARVGNLLVAASFFLFACWLLIPPGAAGNLSGWRAVTTQAIISWGWAPSVGTLTLVAYVLSNKLRNLFKDYREVV